MPERKNWKRHAVEVVVIVGSILLAFGIEAWWSDLGERERERELLDALISDFEDIQVRADVALLKDGLDS